MKLFVIAVYDRAADAYMQPGFAQAIGQAVREFSDMVNTPGHALNKHPEDYTLHAIGIWDDNNGTITCEEKPRQLAIAKDLIRSGHTHQSEDSPRTRHEISQRLNSSTS